MGHNSSKETADHANPSNKHSILSLRRRSHKRKSNYEAPSRSTHQQEDSSSHHTSGGGIAEKVSSFLASSGTNKQDQLEKYFGKYKDDDEDAILAEGIERFCNDLEVDPTEYVVLVVAWKFEASQMARFSREEFVNGCQKMAVYDSKSLRSRFPELKKEAKEDSHFKDLYRFTFTFGLDHSVGQRSLPVDMAIALWELVFEQNPTPVLLPWCQFLRDTNVKGISRDTWNLFLPFCTTIEQDFINYDESEAWPSLFDDFVDHEKQRL